MPGGRGTNESAQRGDLWALIFDGQGMGQGGQGCQSPCIEETPLAKNTTRLSRQVLLP